MENRTISQRLALAESNVQHGEARVNRQRTLVKHFERHGLGTLHARKLLKELEEIQAFFVADRDRLKSEMALSAAGQEGQASVIELRPNSPAISADR